jgi:hypothetical protein
MEDPLERLALDVHRTREEFQTDVSIGNEQAFTRSYQELLQHQGMPQGVRYTLFEGKKAEAAKTVDPFRAYVLSVEARILEGGLERRGGDEDLVLL